jgi:uncharacterized cupin superfamily protein
MTTTAAAHRLAHYGDLVTLELAEDGPRAGATAGTPVESSKTLYADTVCEIGVWECTPGTFPGAKDGIGEHMLILAGDATVIGRRRHNDRPASRRFVRDARRLGRPLGSPRDDP